MTNKDERKRAKETARLQTVLDFMIDLGRKVNRLIYGNKNSPKLEGNLLEKTRRLKWNRTTDASFRAVMVWHDLGRIQPWKLL